MSKSTSYRPNDGESSQKKDWVRIISFGIIGLCVIMLFGLLGTMVWRATNNNPDIYRVIITTDSYPDSLTAYSYMNYEQADSLIKAVKKYDEQLTRKYQYLVEQKEQDSQVFYWGSLIVGIVIAVFGWFGFQSFTTIEDKAKSKASVVAGRTAWTATQKFLKEEGKVQIREAAKDNLQGESVKKVKEEVLNKLNTIIENRMKQYMPSNKVDDLDKRIEALEKSIQPEVDKAVSEAVKNVFEKYRRPMMGGSNNKENKK